MKIRFSAACCLFLVCSQANTGELNEINGTHFALLSPNGTCRLVILADDEDAVIRLPLSGSCMFHVDEAGALRTITTGKSEIFLIETSTPIADGDCRTEVLAVKVGKESVELAPSPALVASCLPFMWDPVMFLGVF